MYLGPRGSRDEGRHPSEATLYTGNISTCSHIRESPSTDRANTIARKVDDWRDDRFLVSQ